MVDPRNAYFNQVYDAVFVKVKKYIITKCHNLADVEDILQDTFLEFYTLICKKGVEYIRNAEAMIMHIAKTKLHKHYRLLSKIKNLPFYAKRKGSNKWTEIEQVDEVRVEQQYINAHTVDEIWKIITAKDELTQKIFALFYYDDLSITEIASQLKLGESNVKHRLYRTLAEVRSKYGKED